MTGVGAGKAADLAYWEGAARMIASVSTTSKIIVEKSTVPVKTAEAIGKVGHTSQTGDRETDLKYISDAPWYQVMCPVVCSVGSGTDMGLSVAGAAA